ncbi:hypothetical protein BgiBS90_037880 [Biomphalaria glabrata]|nr:hypothetical protein BgiBS90_037880 [Biomphalaria glabrata]
MGACNLGFHDIERYLEDLDTQDQEPQSQQHVQLVCNPNFLIYIHNLEQRSQRTPSVDRPPQSLNFNHTLGHDHNQLHLLIGLLNLFTFNHTLATTTTNSIC